MATSSGARVPSILKNWDIAKVSGVIMVSITAGVFVPRFAM